jgi:hypothetical protein
VADVSYDGAGCVVTDSRRIGLDPGQCLFPISQQAVSNNVGGGAPSLSMTKTGITFVDQQPGEQWIVRDANWTICPGCGLQVWLQLRAADVVPPPQSYRPQWSTDNGSTWNEFTNDLAMTVYIGADKLKSFGQTITGCQLDAGGETCLDGTYFVGQIGSHPPTTFPAVPRRKEFAVNMFVHRSLPLGTTIDVRLVDGAGSAVSGTPVRLTVGKGTTWVQ